MPTYLVTDKHTNTRVMVEAQRPQGALAVLIADRFTLSPALEAAEAIRHTREGVPFIDEGESAPAPQPTAQPDPKTDERPPLGAFSEVAVSGWDGDPINDDSSAFGEMLTSAGGAE